METTSTKFQTVDEYISSFSGKQMTYLKELRKMVREAAPDAEEVISYNMPALRLKGMLIYYAAWKEHIGFYGATGKLTKVFKEDLHEYDTSKGTIKFPLEKPLPTALIKKIVRYRVQENLEKAALKKKK